MPGALNEDNQRRLGKGGIGVWPRQKEKTKRKNSWGKLLHQHIQYNTTEAHYYFSTFNTYKLFQK
jgi:hypothetical protein